MIIACFYCAGFALPLVHRLILHTTQYKTCLPYLSYEVHRNKDARMWNSSIFALQGRWCASRLPKPGSIGEADAPRAIPRAVCPLIFQHKFVSLVKRSVDLWSPVIRVLPVESCQASHAGRGELHIVVVYHDVPKSLCWVELLQKPKGVQRTIAALLDHLAVIWQSATIQRQNKQKYFRKKGCREESIWRNNVSNQRNPNSKVADNGAISKFYASYTACIQRYS